MDIYVLNSSFEKIGIIDYCHSIIWTRRYCSAGDFELYLPATTNALELLVDGNIVMRSDDQTSLMIIKTVNLSTDAENGNYLTVTGPSIESYIAKRIVWVQTNLNGPVENCVIQLMNENLITPSLPARKINNIQIGTICNCGISITKQVTGTNLLEAIIDMLDTYKLGFNLTFEKTVLKFNIYQGTDRSYNQNINPYVTFSHEFDNILSSQYQTSSENFKNVALVAGEGQGVSRKTYTVGNTSGLNRDEIYIDAREISSNTDGGTLTPDEYNALLAEKGNEALAESVTTESFEGNIEANTNYIFNRDYFLGDIVNIENEYGITAIVRITEVIESWDENGYNCIPTFNAEEV